MNWTNKDGEIASTDATFSFIVTRTDTLTANFELKTYDVIVEIIPAGSGNVVLGSGEDLPCGSTTLLAIPAPCYTFVGWTENNITVSTDLEYTFLLTESRNLIAHFELMINTITASALPPEGGTVFPENGMYFCGTTVTVTATPTNDCWYFDSWTENDVPVWYSAEYTFPVMGDRILIANFIQKTYNITVLASPSGGGSVFGGGAGILCGTTVTITADPASCYKFINWTKNGVVVSTNPSYTFTATEGCTYIAHFALKVYDVVLSADPEDGGTVIGGDSYTCGTPLSILAVPTAPCYKFVNWTEDGVVVSTYNPYSFFVTGSRNLVAHFEFKTFDITVVANQPSPYGGTVEGGGIGIPCETPVIVTATPDPGYTFINWTENGEEVSQNLSYLFIATKNRTLIANFEHGSECNIILSASPSEGGTVEVPTNYSCNEEVTIKAFPNNCWKFVNWTKNDGTVVSTNAFYTFTVTGIHILTANFEQKTYNITLYANPSTCAVEGGGSHLCGDTITVTALSCPCYEFVSWTESNGVVASTDPEYSFVVTQNRILVANFIQANYEVNVSATPPEYGTAHGNSNGTNLHCGDTWIVWAEPNPDYLFVKWTENDEWVSDEQYYSFTITGSRDLVAHFSEYTHEIILLAEPEEGGAVEGGGNYLYGEEITVKAFPNECWTFVNWTENDVEVSDDAFYTFTVTGPRTLTANFERKTFDVTLSANPSEGGIASGGGIYDCDEKITVKATANTGYKFINWTKNGIEVSTDNLFIFTLIEDMELVANFEKTEVYQVNVSVNNEEYGTVYGGGPYEANETATIIAVAFSGSKFINWTKNGTENITNNPYIFTVTEDVELVANFEGVGIEETDDEPSLRVYPNPTTGELRITNYELRIENIEVFDVMGKHVQSLRFNVQDSGLNLKPETLNCETVIDISQFPAGVYFIRIQTETGVVTRKVVKQ
jgi:hypothetical protein